MLLWEGPVTAGKGRRSVCHKPTPTACRLEDLSAGLRSVPQIPGPCLDLAASLGAVYRTKNPAKFGCRSYALNPMGSSGNR